MYDNVERAAFRGVVNGVNGMNLTGNFRVSGGPGGHWNGNMTSMPGIQPAPTLAVTPEPPPVP